MDRLLWTVLRSAIPAAVVLGVAGLGLRELARLTPSDDPAALVAATRHVPLTMAAWGFGLATLFALAGAMWRGKPTPAPEPAPAGESGLDPEVERLLNRLLAEAAAAESVAVRQVDEKAAVEKVAVAD